MTGPWRIRIYDKQQLVHSADVSGPLELGRQKNTAEELFVKQKDPSGRLRLVIARLDEINVSRTHALLESLGDDRIWLKNESTTQSIGMQDGSQLGPHASGEVSLPAVLTLGKKTVRIQGPETSPEPVHLQSLASVAAPPGFGAATRLASFALPAGDGMDMEALMLWLQAAMGVLQSAASSLEFFSRAAQALVDLVGLDSGQVLLLEKNDWKVQARNHAEHVGAVTDTQPSRQVLSRVLEEKRTFWQVPASAQHAASLVGIKALVAAPILDRHGEVIGALYGDRWKESAAGPAKPITKLDAMLVELLASGVAAGLARVEQEQAALRARVQFEQFFTPELSRELAAHPDLLQGRDAEVSMLFCDIRGFSRISERLGPARTFEWIGDIMGTLSECVLEHRGVLVDYIGDEIIAMWGAPEQQPNHAALACQAALAMLENLPKINERWQQTLQEPMGLGIGINTGIARVGNTGTIRKLKYGPLGNTVNLASRVQGATKYLKTRLLITEATQARLDASFVARRLCKVRVVNIAEPVHLYELVEPDQPDIADLKTKYEEALVAFENADFRSAVKILGNLVTAHRDDGPALILLARAVNALVEEPGDFDAVWELPGK